MEKSGYGRVIGWKEVRVDDPIEYFLPTVVKKFLLNLRGVDGS